MKNKIKYYIQFYNTLISYHILVLINLFKKNVFNERDNLKNNIKNNNEIKG